MNDDFTESFKEKLAAKEFENEQSAEAEEYYRLAGQRACGLMRCKHERAQSLAASCLDWDFLSEWMQELAIEIEIIEPDVLIERATEALWGDV
jgi:hypothetical protein